MMATVQQDNNNLENTNQWYRPILYCAVIAALTSAIVIALLTLNYLQLNFLDPLRAERLETLKLNIQDHPNDEILLQQIRQLDLQIRQDRTHRGNFNSKGAFLLLGSLVLFVLCAKTSQNLKTKPSQIHPPTLNQAQQVQNASRARWSVTAAMAILAAFALFFATSPVTDYQQTTQTIAPYPSPQEIAQNWPRFLGPGGLGTSSHSNIPTSFDVQTKQAVLWKSPIPLDGYNSPIVWDDHVFVSGADKNKRQVYCYDARSGKLLWQKNVLNLARNADKVKPMEDTGFAASSMTTDGRRAYAIFATGDIVSFDFEGNPIWAINLPAPDSVYGYATSLAMYRDTLLVQYDHGTADDDKSQLLALDSLTGRIVWQRKRPVPNSWTSPIVAETPNGPQIITCADPWVIAYEPQKGTELWRVSCLGTDVAPSPIFAKGLVFAIEPYYSLIAIKPDGNGDVTKTHIAWTAEGEIPDICSPVSDGQSIFLLTTEGILSCYNIDDGKFLYKMNLEQSFHASPTLVGNHLYLLSDNGTMIVVESYPHFKEITRSQLHENCYASPAFADGRIYIRTTKNLYCLGI